MKLKQGDEVIVVSGRDKGQKGKIDRVISSTNKVAVAGVNMYKKNMKAAGKTKQAGIIDIVRPMPIANVAFVCPKCKLPTRIGYVIKNDKKSRICKKCDQIVD